MIKILCLLIIFHIGVSALELPYKAILSNKYSGVYSVYTEGKRTYKGSLLYYQSKPYINASFKLNNDITFGIGSWFNKSTDDLLFKNVVLPSGLFAKFNLYGMNSQVFYLDDKTYFKTKMLDFMTLSFLHEDYTSVIKNIPKTRYTTSLILDFSNTKEDTFRYNLKGAVNFSTTESQNNYAGGNGTGHHLLIGMPYTLFKKLDMETNITKIGWYWDTATNFQLDTTYFYEFSRAFSTLRNGQNVDAYMFEHTMQTTFNQYDIFFKYNNLTQPTSQQFYYGGIKSHLGFDNMLVQLHIEHSTNDDTRLILGATLLNTLTL